MHFAEQKYKFYYKQNGIENPTHSVWEMNLVLQLT